MAKRRGSKKIGRCSHACAGKGKKNAVRGKCISRCMKKGKKAK